MKVSNIQNNSNPNFGMALKINPELKSKLLSSSPETIQQLNKIGKAVENVKLYNVCYERDVYTPAVRNVEDGKDYFTEFRREEGLLGKFYQYTCGDDTYQGFNPKEPFLFKTLFGENAAAKYQEYTNLPNVHEKAAALSELLEKRDLKFMSAKEAEKQEKLAKEIEEKNKKAQQEIEVNNLLLKYQSAESQNKSSKKKEVNLFKRMGNKFTSLLSK